MMEWEHFENFEVLAKETGLKSFTKKEEQILLAIFQLDRDAYLMTIRERIKAFTGKTYSVGTIYAPLDRLHRHGYLTAILEKPEIPAGGKPIKYYRLTARGLRALAALKRQTALMWEGVEVPAFEE